MARTYQIFFLLCVIVFVQSIDIRTSSFVEIYSGPGGTVSSDYKNPNSAVTFSKYESTVNFVILGTSLEQYYYEPIAEAFGPPTLKVIKGDGVIDPVLYGAAASGYYFDSTNTYWLEIPELGVYFNCQKDGTATIEISILTSLVDDKKTINETITFYMQKVCYYTGYREGFSVGKEDERNDDVVKHGVVQSAWSLESYEFFGQSPVVIPEKEHLSVFRISISNPDYGNQYYDPPVVYVEDREVLDLQVRGSADNGGVATSHPESLIFFYTCKQAAETNVIIVIHLGFYGSIEFGFIKECGLGGGAELHDDPAGSINVGVSKSDYSNIVANSHTSVEWNAEYPQIVVGTEDLLSIFYVSTLSGREQPFLSPVVSVYPNNAFKVTVSGSVRDGGVATGSPQRFVVNYICEKVSEAHVIVTIKLPGYDTVEFGYTKKCVKLIRHQDHIYTANQILIGLLAFIGVVILIGIYVLKKRKSELESVNRKNFKV